MTHVAVAKETAQTLRLPKGQTRCFASTPQTSRF